MLLPRDKKEEGVFIDSLLSEFLFSGNDNLKLWLWLHAKLAKYEWVDGERLSSHGLAEMENSWMIGEYFLAVLEQHKTITQSRLAQFLQWLNAIAFGLDCLDSKQLNTLLTLICQDRTKETLDFFVALERNLWPLPYWLLRDLMKSCPGVFCHLADMNLDSVTLESIRMAILLDLNLDVAYDVSIPNPTWDDVMYVCQYDGDSLPFLGYHGIDFAKSNGEVTLVEEMIRSGYDDQVIRLGRVYSFNMVDINQMSLLMLAVKHSRFRLAVRLIWHGTDPRYVLEAGNVSKTFLDFIPQNINWNFLKAQIENELELEGYDPSEDIARSFRSVLLESYREEYYVPHVSVDPCLDWPFGQYSVCRTLDMDDASYDPEDDFDWDEWNAERM